MARVKKGVNAHKRHKKVLKMAKGFYGARSKTFKAAKPATMRALRSAYVGRKNKKRLLLKWKRKVSPDCLQNILPNGKNSGIVFPSNCRIKKCRMFFTVQSTI